MAVKRGFSLIELTVVVGLLALLSLAISSSLLMSIVSTNRVRSITKVKQAGNFALDQIQSLIRGARTLSACDSSLDSLTLVNQDGGSTILTTELDGSFTRIASNSGIYLTPSNLDIANFSLTCTPTDDNPNLIKISFNLVDPRNPSTRENPNLSFETSVNLRND